MRSQKQGPSSGQTSFLMLLAGPGGLWALLVAVMLQTVVPVGAGSHVHIELSVALVQNTQLNVRPCGCLGLSAAAHVI